MSPSLTLIMESSLALSTYEDDNTIKSVLYTIHNKTSISYYGVSRWYEDGRSNPLEVLEKP